MDHKKDDETEHEGCGSAPTPASVGKPATPPQVQTAAAEDGPSGSGVPAKNKRGRGLDEDQPADASLTGEPEAVPQQAGRLQEEGEEGPAKRHKATGAALSRPGDWVPGRLAERQERKAAAEAERSERSYNAAREKSEHVGRWLRELESTRRARNEAEKKAEKEAQERDKQLVQDFVARHTAKGRRPELLAAIASHSTRRQELLEVLRKEPRSAYELSIVNRLYSEAEAEAEAEGAEGAPTVAEAGQ